jgi:hypothetical protein
MYSQAIARDVASAKERLEWQSSASAFDTRSIEEIQVYGCLLIDCYALHAEVLVVPTRYHVSQLFFCD